MPERKNEIFEGKSALDAQGAMGGGDGPFEVPIIDVPLPSGGVTYPEGNPLSGQSMVTITTMTAAQENILTNRSLAKRGTLLTHLIQSCLKDKRIRAKELLIGDRNTIMVALRISGYRAEYDVKIECPACEEQTRQKFMLDALPVRRLELQPINPGMNQFEFMLPMSRKRVVFRFLTGIEEEEIAQTQAQKKKVGNIDAELVTSGLLHTIISLDGITDRSRLASVLPQMPAFDSRALRSYIQDNEPGMQLKGEMECEHCGHAGEVDVPLGPDFFWPKTK